MFGYVRPRKDELKLRDYDAYHAAYCGLCRAMGKRYGFITRMLVNYDMTFLYLSLRAGLSPACESRLCYCPARVFRRKRCICDDRGYELTAACNVILCYEKLNDAVEDANFFRSIPARIGRRFLRRAYKKAAKEMPDFAKQTAEKLAALHKLESEKSDSIDATADTFAIRSADLSILRTLWTICRRIAGRIVTTRCDFAFVRLTERFPNRTPTTFAS